MEKAAEIYPTLPRMSYLFKRDIGVLLALGVFAIALMLWSFHQGIYGLTLISCCVAGSIAMGIVNRKYAIKHMDEALSVLSEKYHLKLEADRLVVRCVGVSDSLPLHVLKSASLSYPILHIKTNGFRFDKKYRLSYLQKDELTAFVATVQSAIRSISNGESA